MSKKVLESGHMRELLISLEQELQDLGVGESVDIVVAGSVVKPFVDMAQIFGCTLQVLLAKEGSMTLKFQKLNRVDAFHEIQSSEQLVEAKYGVDSSFATIDKTLEPAFYVYFVQALKRMGLEDVSKTKTIRILNLGVNRGDEFTLLQEHFSAYFENFELVGVDYCQSAITQAKKRFNTYENMHFYTHDISKLDSLAFGKFDVILSIGTLQSSSLAYKPLLMDLVQNYLHKEGAMLLGFPNCRWYEGEMVYGAKVKNYNFSELGLMLGDVMFAKKYLQQKRFRVTVTGREYLFVTATSLQK